MNFTRPFFNIEIHEGSPYSVTFQYLDDIGLPVDISNYTARLQVRINNNGTYDGYAVPYKVLDLTEFTLTEDGNIVVFIPGNQTDNLNWNRGVYDLFLIPPEGEAELFLQGFFTILSSVTKVFDNSDPTNGPPLEERCQPDFTYVPEFD